MDLSCFFKKHPKAALAFSGGTDSAYLLYEAIRCGAQVKPYYVKSSFQPESEFDDAKKTARALNAEMKTVEIDILSVPEIAANHADRCYYCKKFIFSAIAAQAAADGYHTLIDGTNASDDAGTRPGMKALRELSVLSPLRECGLIKSEIRDLSQKGGLSTWNKPACACLATRISEGEEITEEKLKHIEKAESFLFSLGFRNFRIRTSGDRAKIEVTASQFEKAAANRNSILQELKKYYTYALLDLETRNE